MKRVLVLLLCLLLLCGCGRHSDQSPLSTRPSLGPGQPGAAQPVQPPQLDTVAVEGAPGFYILSDLPQLSSYAISAARLPARNQSTLSSVSRARSCTGWSWTRGLRRW